MNKLLLILLILESALIFKDSWSHSRAPDNNPSEILTESSPKTNLVATTIPTPTPAQLLPRFIDNHVPFTSQAPFAEWDDPRFQDGCEEASALMAVKWARGERINSPQAAKDEIIALADYQTQNFGGFTDTSAADTVERIIKGYFKYNGAEAVSSVTLDDIKQHLFQGRIVLAPADGTKLGNPNFSNGGPERHMVLIRGFDPATDELITNDAGTRRGEGYRYDQSVLYAAIRDYPTGNHQPIIGEPKNIIVVSLP